MCFIKYWVEDVKFDYIFRNSSRRLVTVPRALPGVCVVGLAIDDGLSPRTAIGVPPTPPRKSAAVRGLDEPKPSALPAAKSRWSSSIASITPTLCDTDASRPSHKKLFSSCTNDTASPIASVRCDKETEQMGNRRPNGAIVESVEIHHNACVRAARTLISDCASLMSKSVCSTLT